MGGAMTMTVDDIRKLKTGDLVRATIPVSGGVGLTDGGEIEVELPAGAVATVDFVDHLPEPQGWAVWLHFDNGIGNTFDEGDDSGVFHLERVEPSLELALERMEFLTQHSPPDYPDSDLRDDLRRIMMAEIER